MKNIYSYPFLALILITLITSCKYQNKGNKNLASDTLLTKTIKFPNSLLKLEGTQFYKIDSFKNEIEDKKKIISIIDGGCMKCIANQLNKVDSIFNDILYNEDDLLIIILNVSQEDSVFFMRNLQPAIKAKGVILWDNNYNFERQNKLFTSDMNLRTFMVSNENKIIQYGNPVMHPNVIYEYQEKLENNFIEE